LGPSAVRNSKEQSKQFRRCALWLATSSRPSYACTLRRVGRQRAVRVEGRRSGLEAEDGVQLNFVKADYMNSTTVLISTHTPTCAPNGGPLTEALCLKVQRLSRRRDVCGYDRRNGLECRLPTTCPRRCRPHGRKTYIHKGRGLATGPNTQVGALQQHLRNACKRYWATP